MSLLVDEFRKLMAKRNVKEATNETLYPTGFLNFDFMNGYIASGKDPNTGEIYDYYNLGICDGSINMVISRSGGGKSTLCAQIASNIVRPFEKSHIIEENVEAGMTTERRMQLSRFNAEEYHERYIVRNEGITIESFFNDIKEYSDKKLEQAKEWEYDTGVHDMYGNPIIKLQPTVFILDSLAMLASEKVFEETDLAGQMAASAAARAMSTALNTMVPICKKANIIVFMINHINKDIQINPMIHTKAATMYLKQGETLPKGVKPLYACTNIIRIDDNKLKEDKGFGFNGSLSTVSLVKSRTARPDQGTTFVFNSETGFDPELSLFMMLKEAGKINGAGVGCYFGDHSDIKFSQKTFLEKLHSSPELQMYFQEACYEELVRNIRKPELQEIKQSETVNSLLDKFASKRVV